jgi:hypothetical protein
VCEREYTWSVAGVKRLCLSLTLCFLVRHSNQTSLHHDDVSTEHRQARQARNDYFDHEACIERSLPESGNGHFLSWVRIACRALTILEPMLK